MKTLKEFMNEGKFDYPIYHSTYSAAISTAIEYAAKQGFEVDADDRWNKIAVGPGRPKLGKTVKHSLGLTKNGKPQKKALQIQVFNNDGKLAGAPYELNVYIR